MPRMSMSPGTRTELHASSALLNLARLLALPSFQLSLAVQEELASNPALEEVVESRRCDRCGGPVFSVVCPACAENKGAWEYPPDTLDFTLTVASPQRFVDVVLVDMMASLPSSEHAIAEMLVGSLTGAVIYSRIRKNSLSHWASKQHAPIQRSRCFVNLARSEQHVATSANTCCFRSTRSPIKASGARMLIRSSATIWKSLVPIGTMSFLGGWELEPPMLRQSINLSRSALAVSVFGNW